MEAIEPMTRDAQALAANPKSHENVAQWVQSNKKVAFFINSFKWNSLLFRTVH
jgi:hypothetical protein